jgi:hypothetical protein
MEPQYDPEALQRHIDRIDKTIATLMTEVQRLQAEKVGYMSLKRDAEKKRG